MAISPYSPGAKRVLFERLRPKGLKVFLDSFCFVKFGPFLGHMNILQVFEISRSPGSYMHEHTVMDLKKKMYVY